MTNLKRPQLVALFALAALPFAALSKPLAPIETLPTPTPAASGSGTIAVFKAHRPHGPRPSGAPTSTVPAAPSGTGTPEKPTAIGYVDASGKFTTTETSKGTFTVDASSIKSTAGTCGFASAAATGQNGTQDLGIWGCGSSATGGQLTINLLAPPQGVTTQETAGMNPPTFLVIQDSAQPGKVQWSLDAATDGAQFKAAVRPKHTGVEPPKSNGDPDGGKPDLVHVEFVWQSASAKSKRMSWDCFWGTVFEDHEACSDHDD